jgi:hemerythrin-like domain-containing protein
MLEQFLIGDDPEKALNFKEEKIIEALQMIREGNVDAAKKAFEQAKKYGEVLQREVSPDIEKRARESSKAVKEVFDEIEDDIEGSRWRERSARVFGCRH